MEEETEEWENEEINSDTLQNKEDWDKKYEKKHVPEHPYCTNWPVNKKKGENEKIQRNEQETI